MIFSYCIANAAIQGAASVLGMIHEEMVRFRKLYVQQPKPLTSILVGSVYIDGTHVVRFGNLCFP